jgi:excisionase family DNA binding protein
LNTDNGKEWYALSELQAWLGISRSKSYEIIQPGPDSLPAFRIGKTIRVRRQDVEDWLENHKYYSEFSVRGVRSSRNH